MGVGRRIAAAVAAILAATASAQPRITSIGVLPGGAYSRTSAISGDGAAAVGGCFLSPGGYRAVRWTRAEGLRNLGLLPGGTASYAVAVSADGAVVAGYCDLASGGRRAFVWDAASGVRDLGVLDGLVDSTARAISADGATVLGFSAAFQTPSRMFTWTDAGGLGTLPTPPGYTEYSADGISPDGAVVVGSCHPVSDSGVAPCVWERSGNFRRLPRDGAWLCRATLVNAGGSVVAGTADSLAVRWTDGAMEPIPALGPRASSSGPAAMNAAGTIILGWSREDVASAVPWLWSAATGTVPLGDHLTSLGVNLGSWSINEATGISADGAAMTGVGRLNGQVRGWIVTGLPAPCAADVDGDGFLDMADYAAFVACFEGGACPTPPASDFNRDGFLDFFDYADFVAAFELGC